MTIHQLAFDFTRHRIPANRSETEKPWTIVWLARRYRLTESQASIYALEMRLPTGEAR
jgi:hypothetical protein